MGQYLIAMLSVDIKKKKAQSQQHTLLSAWLVSPSLDISITEITL